MSFIQDLFLCINTINVNGSVKMLLISIRSHPNQFPHYFINSAVHINQQFIYKKYASELESIDKLTQFCTLGNLQMLCTCVHKTEQGPL